MADLKPSDMLNVVIAEFNAAAEHGVMPAERLSAKMEAVQAGALISISYSLDRIAAALEAANHA